MKGRYLIIVVLFIIGIVSCSTVKESEKSNNTNEVEEQSNTSNLEQKSIVLEDIVGKKLFWVQTLYNNDTKSVPSEKRAYIVFQEKGNLQIQSVCNMGRGMFVLNDKSIELNAQMTTKIACKTPSVEYKFFKNLSSAIIAFQKGNKIYFDLKMHEGTMEFEIEE